MDDEGNVSFVALKFMLAHVIGVECEKKAV